MITWFYSKFAIYMFSIIVFMVLLAILYDFLASGVFLRNVSFAKYVMFLHYVRYVDQSDVASKSSLARIVLTAKVTPRDLRIACHGINCTETWSYLGTPGKISFLVPYYYRSRQVIYSPRSDQVRLSLILG